jgi:glycosyltransferase involved in cell wall biosynthesis
MKYISVIIPTLNEAQHIHHVFPDIPDFIDEGAIQDGKSNDGTREESLKFRNDAKMIVKDPGRKGAAMKTGFDNAPGDHIDIMDADGGHAPKEIPVLSEPVQDGYDVSRDSRMMPGGGLAEITQFRIPGNTMFVDMVNRMYGTDYTDLCFGYRAFKREAREKIACGSTGFGVGTEQFICKKKAGLKVSEVPCYEVRRKHDTPNLNSLWVAYTEYDRTGVYT